MASLIDTLIEVMDEECEIYSNLVEVTSNKTQVIVKGDIDELQKIVEVEQAVVDQVGNLEKKRQVAVSDIAIVLGKEADGLTVADIVKLLGKQPEEQKRLSELHTRLKNIVNQLIEFNAHNKTLLEQSLEMTEFSLSLLQNANRAPETANYTRGAYTSSTIAPNQGMFDAKQ